jgi:hypothetical protein
MEAAGVPRLDVERPFSSNKEAGPPLNAGHWSAWAIAAGQERDAVSRLCRCGGRGTKRAGFLNPVGLNPQLRARDAGVLSSSSDPS